MDFYYEKVISGDDSAFYEFCALISDVSLECSDQEYQFRQQAFLSCLIHYFIEKMYPEKMPHIRQAEYQYFIEDMKKRSARFMGTSGAKS